MGASGTREVHIRLFQDHITFDMVDYGTSKWIGKFNAC
jgi:hypothetical protein